MHRKRRTFGISRLKLFFLVFENASNLEIFLLFYFESKETEAPPTKKNICCVTDMKVAKC